MLFTYGNSGMTNKPKSESDVVWINPRSNFFRAGHQAWDRRSSDISNARYLDLADVALRPMKLAPPVASDTDPHNTTESQASDLKTTVDQS
jgi:hypothetical protein